MSSSVSPFVVDDDEPEMLIASADSRFAASSNDVRVRVEFSKNRLITVRPRSDRQLLDRLVRERPVAVAVIEDARDLRGVEVRDADQVARARPAYSEYSHVV